MKKKALAVLSAAVMATAVMAGCSNKSVTETTALQESTADSSAAETTEGATEAQGTGGAKTELVIAGGDGAGLIAAIQAAKEGTDPSKILIVESSEELGYDIASKEDYINAASTDEQYEQEVDDSFETFLADIKKAGNDKNDQELAEFVAESGEAALDWLRALGIEMEGVTKNEGSSFARSYAASGEVKLTKALTDALLKEVETLKIPVMKGTSVSEILYKEDGSVDGVKLSGKEGEETISCIALVVTDEKLLPVLKTASALYTVDDSGKETGVLVNNCAEVLNENKESVMGLYAMGALIDPAVFGEKALAGNEMTSMILFGSTAGTEASIYISDHQ